MYNPPDPDGAGGVVSDDLEFIEIYNPTAHAVDLAEWRVRGGIDINPFRSDFESTAEAREQERRACRVCKPQ